MRWSARQKYAMQLDDRIRLRHMIEAAEDALHFVKGRARADLDND